MLIRGTSEPKSGKSSKIKPATKKIVLYLEDFSINPIKIKINPIALMGEMLKKGVVPLIGFG